MQEDDAGHSRVIPRRERASSRLLGFAKLVALVLAAGAVGAALGTGLSSLSAGGGPAALEEGAGRLSDLARAGTSATATGTTTATTTAPADPLAQVRVSVLDARLFTDETPSGRQAQRARLTVRVRAENSAGRRLTLPPAVLRVGSVRVAADASGARFDPLAAGAGQTVTLRFSLAGDATPKIVRDRRARILIAGQSVAMRIKVRAPGG